MITRDSDSRGKMLESNQSEIRSGEFIVVTFTG